MIDTKIKHIDLILPNDARNITVTFQLPNNNTTIDNTVIGTLNEHTEKLSEKKI